MQLLLDQEIKEKTTDAIQEYMEHNNFVLNTNSMHKYLVEALQAGRAVIPHKSRYTQRMPWQYDQQLESLSNERRQLRKQNESPQNIEHLEKTTLF